MQVWCDDLGLPVPNNNTSAYSKGRGRLKLDFLNVISARINTHLSARISTEDTHQGHIVKSIEGSSMALDDTEENQAQYPQPTSQEPGCGGMARASSRNSSALDLLSL